jgi:catalase
MTDDRRARHTTNTSGAPTASDEHSLTAGPDGATVLHDHHLIEKLAQFNRERVPERVVHAKGGGAHGFFEVLEDVTQWTRAGFLSEVGRRTPVFARFSTVAGEHGYGDTDRDPRGFAVKLYTDEGNYDLVGNSTPVFFVRDAAKFPDFIHSQKRHPVTGLRSNDMQWDFWSLSPESAHQVIILMSGRGTPKTWRNMNGYGSHTYMWINSGGERFWVKYHWKTAQGIENLTNAEARAMRAEDPDCHRRDLFNAIARREAPEWRLEMQVMPYDDAAGYRFNRPQPGEPLRRGRAGGVRAVQPRARDRPEPRQDADGADVRLPGRAPPSDRHELQPAPDQRAALPGQLLHVRRADAP